MQMLTIYALLKHKGLLNQFRTTEPTHESVKLTIESFEYSKYLAE